MLPYGYWSTPGRGRTGWTQFSVRMLRLGILLQSRALIAVSAKKLPDTGDPTQGGGFSLAVEFSVGHLDCITGRSDHFYLS